MLNVVDQLRMVPDVARLAGLTTRTVTRGARAVFAIPCAASRIALLGSSPVDRMIANFFLGVNSPPCPTRFFTSRYLAVAWLQGAAHEHPASA